MKRAEPDSLTSVVRRVAGPKHQIDLQPGKSIARGIGALGGLRGGHRMASGIKRKAMLDPVATGQATGGVQKNHLWNRSVDLRQERLGRPGLPQPPQLRGAVLFAQLDSRTALRTFQGDMGLDLIKHT